MISHEQASTALAKLERALEAELLRMFGETLAAMRTPDPQTTRPRPDANPSGAFRPKR